MKTRNLIPFPLFRLLLFSAVSATGAFAQDTIPPVSITGFVDTYFSYNFAKPVSGADALRNFDVTDNQFVVSQAEVSISRAAAPIGFHIDADYGPATDLIQTGTTGSFIALQQAYATAVLPVGSGLTLDAGKFVTGMGYEVIKAKDNFNYSRSLSFAWSIPYFHLGLRASYPVSSSLTTTLMIVNGWNGVEVNRMKTFHLCVLYTASPSITFGANWIGGQEAPDSVNKTFRNVVEGLMTISATDKLTFGLDVTYGTEPIMGVTNLWKGLVGYAKYQVSEKCAIALRAEGYWDPEGFTTGTGQNLSEVTATYEYKPLPSLIVRTEFRHDASTATVFSDDTGPATVKSQNTLLLGAIVVF